MIKIDLKDRKILYHLDINSRQSFSQIGKKVGLSKNVVAYRINRLKEEGIINNFYTVVDTYKLGYIIMRLQYKFQYVTPEIEKEIIQYYVNDSSTVLVAATQGNYNLKVILLLKDVNDFYSVWQESQKKFGFYFEQRTSSIFINELYYEPSYLVPEISTEEDRTKFVLVGYGTKVSIDELDTKILSILTVDARRSLAEIADDLDSTIATIKYRINNLQKNGVIKGFRTDINIAKIGYDIYRVNIFLKDYNKRGEIIDFIKQDPHLMFIDTYTSDADLEIELHVENIDQFNTIMKSINHHFPQAIRNYNYINIVKYHKFCYLP